MLVDATSKGRAGERAHPRVPVEAFCTALSEAPGIHAIAVDLSPQGVRIERPLAGRMPRRLQVEFEVPEVDEILWALGEVRYDKIYQVRCSERAPPRVVRSCGIRLVAAAGYHRRLLREYVMDTARDRWAGARPAS